MKKTGLLVLISTLFLSCKSTKLATLQNYNCIIIDTIFKDKINIRAISIADEKVYFAGDKNRVGSINLKNNTVTINTNFVNDTINYEFRGIAQTTNSVFVLNVGNPAMLYKFSKDFKSNKLVYKEVHDKVFYDSMQFWNDNEGIALGDPVENCFSIIITRNGGETWTKISCDKLPKMEEGEAAFAASNSNIVIQGENTWLVSGGKRARVFYSSDKGDSWKVFDTPIVQGESMTGIFSADFYDETIGFIAGGNYEKPNQNFQNKALTIDGGKTWNLVSENRGFGYASCVQFVPKSGGKQLISVGASGLYYSYDSGASWKQFSNDTSLFTVRFINENTAIAAGKDKIIKIIFETLSISNCFQN